MATTTNYSWSTPDDIALVKDGAAAIRSLGTAIDTTVFTNAGAAIAKTLIDAEGDLIVGDAADAVQRLAVGSNGNVLTVDTAVDGKIKWAAPAGGGKVLQVVQGTTTTSTTSSSTSYADTNLTASITPSSASSKILVLVNQNGCRKSTGDTASSIYLQLLRDSTELMVSSFIAFTGTSLNLVIGSASFVYLDSPATTSSTTYKTRFKNNAAAAEVIVQHDSNMSTITLIEIGA